MGRKRKSLTGKAVNKMELVFLVCTGQLTAREAARRLGISPKTYYGWEKRILEASAKAVENKPSGRPGSIPDPEKEDLKAQNRELQRRVTEMEMQLKVKDVQLEWRETLRQAGLIRGPEKKKEQ